MRSSRRSVNALSPESTVTSLLSSSGHLTSDPQLGPSASFSYKDQLYHSASAALEAYITDFERGRHGNTPKGAGLAPSTSRRSTLRNRDVLRERLSEQELDFLTLPVSSLRHRDNRDRFSMTTDELLNLPNDGSMPITHTSAFLHGLASQSRVSQDRSPVKNTCSHSHAHRGSQPIRALRCSRCSGGTQRKTLLSSTLKPRPTRSPSQWAESSSAPRLDWPSSRDQVTMHLPHWLSSNKAALDCSEVQSLPDLPYPPWVQHCHSDQSEHSGSHRDDQSERACGQDQSQGGEIEDFPASALSWVLQMSEDQPMNSEETLRNLRLQFAQHISHRTSMDSRYRDRRIESLIQKADQVLDSLQNSTTGSPVPPGLDSLQNSTTGSPVPPVSLDPNPDLLLRDLDPSLDLSLDLSLDPSLKQVQDSVGSQPGPLEAFKQILFRLQAVETELHRRQQGLQQGAQQGAHKVLSEHTEDPEDEEPSLQRALHHLSRLKLLVEKPEEPLSRLKLLEEKPEEPLRRLKLLEEKPEEPLSRLKLLEEKPEEPLSRLKLLEEKPEEPLSRLKLLEEKPEEPLSRLKLLEEKPEELCKDVYDEERDEGHFSSCSVDDQQGALQAL